MVPAIDEVLRAGHEQQTDGRRVAALYEMRFAALSRFAEIGHWQIEWARGVYWWSQKDYADTWRELAGDPRFGKLHQQPTVESLFQSACVDVLQILGFALFNLDHALPPQLKLGQWRSGKASLVVNTARFHQSGLVGPRTDGLILGATFSLSTERGP